MCYISPQTSGLALGPIQPPIQLPPGVKQPGHDADHSPASGAEVNSVCGGIPLLPYMHASITCRGTTFTLQWACLRTQDFMTVCMVSLVFSGYQGFLHTVTGAWCLTLASTQCQEVKKYYSTTVLSQENTTNTLCSFWIQ